MPPKSRRRRPVVTFELTLVASLDTGETNYGVITVYEDRAALFSITMPDGFWRSEIDDLVRFAWSSYNETSRGQLQLPDMGDYQIRYHTDTDIE